ncbi:hypothetical protein BKA62DRAFT_757713 [Auriculariales sp. MPI-PUGE-AT-0066]|nr:hypothetical protein BKA62DRAFT_757713 [Auriculariales sp. MPI-PUGE-AT-0066]
MLHSQPMPVPASGEIYPVLVSGAYSHLLHAFVDEVRTVKSSFYDYLARIDRCHVIEVGHYRSKGKTCHEFVALTMRYMEPETGAPFTRYFRLDRYRAEDKSSEKGSVVTKSTQSLEITSSLSLDYQNWDKVLVSHELVHDTLGIMKNNYQEVRKFTIQPGTLPIIDALVLAHTLSVMFGSYTMLVRMCQYWATNLFLVLKAVVGHKEQVGVTVVKGVAFSSAGKFRNLTLVDIDTGCAKAEFFAGDRCGLRDLYKWKPRDEIPQEIRDQADGLVKASTGGSIASFAEAEAANVENVFTANRVYKDALTSLERLRSEIRSTCKKNYDRNHAYIQSLDGGSQLDFNPVP